jgi:multidrug efflux pump subunit AcrB
LVRLYNQVFSNADFLPQRAGVGTPIVKPKGIDDVPVMALTLWSDQPSTDATRLAEVAHALEADLKRIPGTRDVYTIGAPDRSVLVTLDAAKLAAYGMAANDLAQALQAANLVHQAGERIDAHKGAVPVTAGSYLANAEEVANLVIGSQHGKPLRLVRRAGRAGWPEGGHGTCGHAGDCKKTGRKCVRHDRCDCQARAATQRRVDPGRCAGQCDA